MPWWHFSTTKLLCPRKSLLLNGYLNLLSTYAATDSVLRDMGWNAVLFIATGKLKQRDPSFVYWDRVGRMIASGVWELGSHGHQGQDPIIVDREGHTGPFFIRNMWLAESSRNETWEEFSERVRVDHEHAKTVLEGYEEELLAYAPPLRDVAGNKEAHRSAEAVVRSTYKLVFYDDRFGVNDGLSDPQHLKRLRVNPLWGSEELVARIRFALGEKMTTDLRIPSVPLPWVAGSGKAHRETDELVVTGETRADVWRAGSQRAEDWELELDFRVQGGEFWVVQESAERSEEVALRR